MSKQCGIAAYNLQHTCGASIRGPCTRSLRRERGTCRGPDTQANAPSHSNAGPRIGRANRGSCHREGGSQTSPYSGASFTVARTPIRPSILMQDPELEGRIGVRATVKEAPEYGLVWEPLVHRARSGK